MKKWLPVYFLLVLFITATSASRQGNNLNFTANDSLPSFYKARDHRAKNVISSDKILTLTSGLDNDFFYSDSNSRSGFLYIETKVALFKNDTALRVPLNISIVIDRSGSMQGIKMGHAKRAAKAMIDLLKPEDIVSLVIYDNYIDTLQPPVRVANKEIIKKKIDGIVPRGSTNLWGGTEQGYEFVKRNIKPEFINRVLLISDGLANVGLTDSNLIRLKVKSFKEEQGITISTFGVGLDYNEDLMTDMAENGSGNYYFINAPEKMTGILTNELNGLLTVAARETAMKINMPQGVEVESVYPALYHKTGSEIFINFRDLFSSEVKGVLVKFRIANQVKAPLRFVSSLTYKDVSGSTVRTLTNENILQPVRSVDSYLTHFNRMVIEQILLFNANEFLNKAMKMVDQGKSDSAIVLLQKGHNSMSQYDRYIQKSEELKKMDSISQNYSKEVGRKNLTSDSLKLIQKKNKAASYQVRQKKQ